MQQEREWLRLGSPSTAPPTSARPALVRQVERDCHLLGLGPSCSPLAKGAMGDVWLGLWVTQVLVWWMGGREESTSYW